MPSGRFVRYVHSVKVCVWHVFDICLPIDRPCPRWLFWAAPPSASECVCLCHIVMSSARLDGKYFNKLSGFVKRYGYGISLSLSRHCNLICVFYHTASNDLWLIHQEYTLHPEHLTMMNVDPIASLLRFPDPFFFFPPFGRRKCMNLTF